MIESATGLVLRTRLLTETSLIVEWLTSEAGRLFTVAKGARRANSPFRGKLDLFYLAEISFNRSRRSELHNLREVRLVETHSFLRQDLELLNRASYCAALLEQTTEPEAPIPELFDLLLAFLRTLAGRKIGPGHVFAFELKLLADSGLAPDLNRVTLSSGTRKMVSAFTESAWSEIANLRLSRSQEAELRGFLGDFLVSGFGRVPKGREHATASGF